MRWIVLVAVAAGLFFAVRGTMVIRAEYQPSDIVLTNPYMGHAAWAADPWPHAQPFTLVYADIRWSMLEPEQGVFDFDAIEETFQFDRWRAEGKHVILRFILDMPDSVPHRDIPDWLYDLTADGANYDLDYGKGYAPNYANPILIEAHAKAIEALGARYGSDLLIAFVQLGSLGHWGEWHVYPGLPSGLTETVRDRYVVPYLAAFPAAQILMRRPFAIAKAENFGLYNDSGAHPEGTEMWLDWIQAGGNYEDEQGALVPMPDAWKTAAIGGELSSVMDQEALLDTLLGQTLSLFERSHTSWIGPNSFVNFTGTAEQEQNLDTLMKTIGYRLRVSAASAIKAPLLPLIITLEWENDGIAPFYFDWQPALMVVGEGYSRVIPIPLDIKTVLPGEKRTVRMTIAKADLPKGDYELYAGILNPETHQAGVKLAMLVPEVDGWYRLLEVR